MTIDKGSDDSIAVDMGVMSAHGIIGVVTQTSPHFATVISVLNPKFNLNGKIKRNDYFGPLVWDGKDPQYTYLTELPRHAECSIGDTIVTSGYSSVFPMGLPIGAVVGEPQATADNYMSVKVRLFSDFNRLKEVFIVKNNYQQEKKQVESHIIPSE
jgi:rod shape-determining protein MreC